LQAGKTLTSAVGYTLNYNTLDNNKNPTDGLIVDFKQDFAGVGGDVTYLKSAVDAKYYTPLVADIVGLIHVQGGILNSVGSDIRMLDHFRWGRISFAASRRTASVRATSIRSEPTMRLAARNIGARRRIADAVLVPAKEVGLKARFMPMPARSMTIRTDIVGGDNEINVAGCVPSTRNPVSAGTCTGLVFDNGNVVRTSVGVGLIWASPFGPLRFDYAVPLTKGANDRVQQFKFGGGTSF